MKIYLNGSIIDADQACISPLDRGFTLGDGVFETLYYDGQDFECLKGHYDRLVKGLSLFQIPVDIVISEFKAMLIMTLEANQLIQRPSVLRLTCTRGSAERGIKPPVKPHPTLIITATPYHRHNQSIRLGVSDHVHVMPSALSGIKHLGYQLSILGALEARSRGLDDVVFFNQQGRLVCATSANVFIIRRGVMITPPISDGALPGIMRGKIIQELQQAGTPVKIDHITHYDLETAQRIFLSNSLIGLRHAILEL